MNYCTTSFSDTNVKSEVVIDVFSVHQACFEMRSWLANDVSTLRSIPKEFRANSTGEVVLPNDVHTLGMKWNPIHDTLGFYACVTMRLIS